MRAVAFSHYGPPETLTLDDFPNLEPDEDEILIRVLAAGVNPADCNLRSGRFRLFLRLNLPFIPGSDVAGIVEATGAGVTGFRPGQAVFAMIPFRQGGGYAETVCVNKQLVALMPSNLTFTEAASLPLAGLTSLQALRKVTRLQKGDSLLVYGASGGVGTLLTQIAKFKGLVVTGVCSTRNVAMVAGLGAESVLDYTQPEWDAHQSAYDAVIDAVAALSLRQGLGLAAPDGTFLSLNPGFGNPLFRFFAQLRRRHVQSLMVQADGADLQQLAAWCEQRAIRPCVDRVFALEDAAAAHRYSETKRAQGKIVLQVDRAMAERLPQP